MKLNKKTIAVSTASLLIVGGAAFAYVAQTANATGNGSVAAGSVEVADVKVPALVLDTPTAITFDATATGQVQTIRVVKVEADPTLWVGDVVTKCGVIGNLTGGTFDITPDVVINEGTTTDDVSVAGAVKLANDPLVDQKLCQPPVKVTVNPAP